MFVVLKVDHDHEGNEWLILKNIYDYIIEEINMNQNY